MKTIKFFFPPVFARLRFFIMSLFLLTGSISHGQAWFWGKAGHSPNNFNTVDASPAIATDKSGNAYITGSYTSSFMIFGSDTLNNNEGNVYLTKYNSAGSLIWTKQLVNTTGATLGCSIAADKTGNIYISGSFYGTIQAGIFTLINNSPNLYTSVYLVKYNANGAVLWAKQGVISANVGSTSQGGEVWNSIAADKVGDVFMTGYFADTISFGGITLTSSLGVENAFLTKYDSNGTVLWSKQSEALSNVGGGQSYAVTTDNLGNAYITGWFLDSVSFGAAILSGNNIDEYGFLVKYSSTGNVLWAKQSANNANPRYFTTQANAIVSDLANNIYITGSFSDSVEFDSHILYSPSSEASVFFTKYDTNGNVIWAEQSSVKWVATGLASDAKSHIYMVGFASNDTSVFFDDTLKFGSYAIYKSPKFAPATFLMEFDTSGNPLKGSILNNLEVYGSGGAASDSTGTYIYATSCYSDTVICGPDTLSYQGRLDGYNPFVGRWLGYGLTDIQPTHTPEATVIVYPNPSTGKFTIACHPEQNEESQSIIQVYNVLGEKVFTQSLRLNNQENSIDISNQPSGVYLYRLLSQSGLLVGEGKIVLEK